MSRAELGKENRFGEWSPQIPIATLRNFWRFSTPRKIQLQVRLYVQPHSFPPHFLISYFLPSLLSSSLNFLSLSPFTLFSASLPRYTHNLSFLLTTPHNRYFPTSSAVRIQWQIKGFCFRNEMNKNEKISPHSEGEKAREKDINT